MILNEQQIKTLEPYESYFTTAIRSRYARYPGQTGVKTIYEVYSSVVNNAPRLNASCSSCIFRLLVDCGTIYFKDKKELEQKSDVKPKRTRKKS